MAKSMNVFFGIGVAVLVYVVVLLGIQAFYHDVNYEDYNCTYPDYSKAYFSVVDSCDRNTTVGACLDSRTDVATQISAADQAKYDECNQKFNDATKAYNKNLFLITAIVGALAIVLSTLLIPLLNISLGVSFAGLALIIYGFARGWASTGDMVKFIVAIVIAALVIFLGVRYSNRN